MRSWKWSLNDATYLKAVNSTGQPAAFSGWVSLMCEMYLPSLDRRLGLQEPGTGHASECKRGRQHPSRAGTQQITQPIAGAAAAVAWRRGLRAAWSTPKPKCHTPRTYVPLQVDVGRHSATHHHPPQHHHHHHPP